jgi:hypothetical protein
MGEAPWAGLSPAVNMLSTLLHSKSYSKVRTEACYALCAAVATPVATTGRLIPGCSHGHVQAREAEENPNLGA